MGGGEETPGVEEGVVEGRVGVVVRVEGRVVVGAVVEGRGVVT